MKYAAIIEWSSDAGESPELFLGDDLDKVNRVVVEFLRDHLCDDAYDDDKDFLDNHPYPDTTDAEAVQQWLEDMREATTAPWVEVYRVDADTPVVRGHNFSLRREYRTAEDVA